MYKKLLILTSMVIAFAGLVAFAQTRQVNAGAKIKICHATSSMTNPYNLINISVHGVDDDYHHHSGHTGPLYPNAGWGDIIPAGQIEGLSDGINWTTAGQAIYNNNCEIPDVAVTPATVTFTDPSCGDVRKSYTITATTGVKYYYINHRGHRVYVSAGVHYVTGDKITIKAEAEQGYKIENGVRHEWCHEFKILTKKDCTVIPDEVTFTAPTCELLGSYTIPTTDGVKYSVDGVPAVAGTYSVANGTTITAITAVAETGYYLGDATAEWGPYTFTAPAKETCVQGTESVTPTIVTFTVPTCSALGTYTIPTSNGIKYYIDSKVVAAGKYTVANGKTITITAVADEGFDIKTGATNQWTSTFKTPINCDGSGVTLGTATTLPLTAGESTPATVITLSAAAGIIVILGSILRSLFIKRF